MNLPAATPGMLPLALVAFFWARHLHRRYPEARWAQPLQYASVVLPLFCGAASMLLLLRGFSSVSSTAAELRAQALATNITLSMYFTAAGIVITVAILVTLGVYHSQLSAGRWRGPPGVGEAR